MSEDEIKLPPVKEGQGSMAGKVFGNVLIIGTSVPEKPTQSKNYMDLIKEQIKQDTGEKGNHGSNK